MFPPHTFLSLLFLLASNLANADLQFTSPTSSSSFKGGTTFTVSWREDGSTSPKLSQYDHYTLDLCTGSNTQITPLYTLLTDARLGGADSVQVAVPAWVGGSAGGAKVYFLRMTLTISPTDSLTLQGSTTHFTPRFSLTSMTGLFPPSIPSSLLISAAGTPPPDTTKSLIDISYVNLGEMGPDIPYPSQTGPVRYAPMQKQPGRSITASPTPAGGAGQDGWGFTSTKAETYFKRGAAPRAEVTMTVTKEWDYVVTSLENTASPAPMPREEYERFPKRGGG